MVNLELINFCGLESFSGLISSYLKNTNLFSEACSVLDSFQK